jgi:hypothetical protein
VDVYEICLHLKFHKVYSGVPESHLQVHAAICESYELRLVGVRDSELELLLTFDIWYEEVTFMATISLPIVHCICLKFIL